MPRDPESRQPQIQGEARVESSKRLYTGKVLNLDIDRVRFPNGSIGELEMIRHPGASAIIPFVGDPSERDPAILLIKQYRYAAKGFLYEIPAGRLNPGEDPLNCAQRELKEETGCSARNIDYLFTMFTTPGFTDERIHVFAATRLSPGDTEHEPDEFMTAETMTLSHAVELIRIGGISDAKTALALLYASSFRGRI